MVINVCEVRRKGIIRWNMINFVVIACEQIIDQIVTIDALQTQKHVVLAILVIIVVRVDRTIVHIVFLSFDMALILLEKFPVEPGYFLALRRDHYFELVVDIELYEQ